MLFQPLHLLLIINISETTKYVLKAITMHIDQLMATVLLAFIFIFVFSNLLGSYYRSLFNQDLVKDVDVCRNLLSCYVNTLDLGLRLGGGIAEAMIITDIEDPKYKFYLKLFFNLGFFIFVNIISMNVVFGIIIDTFAELRDKQREREWDEFNI